MTRLRFCGSASMTLVLALAFIQTAIAQAPKQVPPRPLPSSTSDSADPSYKIYSLNDFGNDPGLCEWIAQTIPQVIAVGTWYNSPATISYYAPKNILLVNHTPTVQAQVDTFLKDVKKSLSERTKARGSAEKGHASGSEIVPAAYHEPELRKAAKPTPEPSLSYPVPAQAKAPKHLFHYIIRYEGEGIIDDNVVKALRDYYRAEQAGQRTTAPAPTGYQTAPGSIPPGPTQDSPPVLPTANQRTIVPAPTGYSPSVSPTVYHPPASTPPTPESSAYGTSPATSKPPVKEKEEKKDDKSTEKEKQTR